MKYQLLAIFIIFNTILFGQIDTLNLLELAYTNKSQVELDSFLQKWHEASIPYDTSNTSEVMKNIYDIYDVIYNVPESYNWAFSRSLQSNKTYRIIKPPHHYSIKELKVKAEKDKVMISYKSRIKGKRLLERPVIFDRKQKLKTLRKRSEFFYYKEKYQFEKKVLESKWIDNFSPKIENDSIKFLYINETYEPIIKNYFDKPIHYIDYPRNDKHKFLFENVNHWKCPDIYNITINPTFDFAIVEYDMACLECWTHKYRTFIYLQKIDNRWQMIYPTPAEPYLYYSVDLPDNFRFFYRKVERWKWKF